MSPTQEHLSPSLIHNIKTLPEVPGVYLFKNSQSIITYIGKAKNLKKRVSSYLHHYHSNDLNSYKIDALLDSSVTLDFIATKTELEALLLEAQLIKSHQPVFNILLKEGQPFVYLLITQAKLPELKIVRNKKHKGTYFGPFLERQAARQVYNFLIKIFRLFICKKKIPTGCLYYHMGACAGTCRPDFDQVAYEQRLELAKQALTKQRDEFIIYLQNQMQEHNKQQAFEKSKELHEYIQAFKKIFISLTTPASPHSLIYKDIWILSPDHKTLFLFKEHDGVLKKKQVFYFPFTHPEPSQDLINLPDQESSYLEYFESYYRDTPPAATILINFSLDTQAQENYLKFLTSWHKLSFAINLIHPTQGHYAALIRLATIHAQQESEKLTNTPQTLKRQFFLSKAPRVIDCFDISHQQSMGMVGACIRFVNGQPDKNNFRNFHIKTITTQNDYAALCEIVTRRYKDKKNLPDLIVIDGGKGQLHAVQEIISPDIDIISLAKKEEIVYSKNLPTGKKLSLHTPTGQLLIALRDYTHHAAIRFHRTVQKL
jgi:excinuclease ABC subunit C